MRRLFPVAAAVALSLLPASSLARPVAGAAHPPARAAAVPALRPNHKVGLGKILSTSDGGEIYGFDIDQNGTDGVLASAQTISSGGELLVSMQTFNQDTGKITKTFARYKGLRNSYGVDGIFDGDVALVTHYVTPKGTIYARRVYDVMNPVTAGKFTGSWTPPVKDIDVLQASTDHASSTTSLFAIELKHNDQPIVVVSDVAANTFSNVIKLDPNLFGLGNGPQFGQYTAATEAVAALSPDGGRVGGAAPVNVLIDLTSGKTAQFTGYNNGPFGAGYVNGMAVDPNTGVEATTTELNAQVEFYNLNTQTGINAVQLPCSGSASQSSSGAGIAVDAVNKLFLVTEPFYCNGSQGSALVVYDEGGNLVETIAGFGFAIAEPAPAINPTKRMGWAFGPHFNQLQQFYY